MEKQISPLQLFILFPMETPLKSVNLSERIDAFKKFLVESYWVEDINFLDHIDYQKVFSLIREYVSLKEENLSKYEEIKKLLVTMWGESWYYFFVQNTFFLHQDKYLQKHEICSYLRESLVA